ncbi:MAG TPA: SLC13 family permease [Candidatus Krumholzibacteria bacterium]|jgi:di/tricarboxylate transporter
MSSQYLVFGVLTATLGLLAWGRLRYDLVALSSVTLLVLGGVLEPRDVFHGFGNDAVLSVIAIMVVGRAIRLAGATEPFAALLLRFGGGMMGQSLSLTAAAALFSSFMNNTGALTVFLPVAVHIARSAHRLASSLLMPLAFATLLGGLITLIGTPPNILVSAYREETLGTPFALFDYTPVGLGIALVGLAFLATVGWRLLPPRRGSVSLDRSLRMRQYFAEVRVPQDSLLAGHTLRELEDLGVDSNVVGVIRGNQRIAAPLSSEPIEAGDLLLVEADAEQLDRLIARAGLELGEDRIIAQEEIGGPDVALAKLVVSRGSPLVGRTPKGLRMRWRYGMNVLAISRQGARIVRRISAVRIRAGDVLFVQIREEAIGEVIESLHLHTLEDTEHHRPNLRRLAATMAIFFGAMVGVATGAASLGICFLAAALLLMMFNLVSVHEATTSVDWSIVILLGSTIPLGVALERTGGATTIATGLMHLARDVHPVWALTFLMVVTMLLSNMMNNAATAVLMAPIAYRLSQSMGVNADPFLMAVAVGASACFLTPIGHQCNILVMGPGGYRFSDYARLGAPLSVLVLVVGVPLIVWFWPL